MLSLLPHRFPSWAFHSYLKRFHWLEIENKEGIIIGQLPLKYFCILPQRPPKGTLLGARATPAWCQTEPTTRPHLLHLAFLAKVGDSWDDRRGVGFGKGPKPARKREEKRFAPVYFKENLPQSRKAIRLRKQITICFVLSKVDLLCKEIALTNHI